MSINNPSLGLELALPGEVPPVYVSPPDLAKGKNIIVCADGTGNADVKGRGSNVFKLFEAIDTTSHLHNMNVPRQVAFYDEGVGTESWWPRRVLGGAMGVGLKTNICELYQEIARVYEPGDRLYLFGFSRGAFTVRALAGLIDCCGILVGSTYMTKRQLMKAARCCFDEFVRHGDDDRGRDERLPRHDHVKIEFIGVWDTVDAVGLSFKPLATWINRHLSPFKPEVHALPKSVRYACQALALDDERAAFTPEVWSPGENIEQVWFAGVHSDIGGGYPRQGLSLIALDWMMERAQARGLRFVVSDQLYYDEHQIVADKLHDARAGAAVYYRWRPRDVTALCGAGVRPHVHVSVFDRLVQGVDGYAPMNIPASVVINFTERRDWKHLDPSAVQNVLHQNADVFLAARQQARPVIKGGVRAYWAFILATLALLAGGGEALAWYLGGASWPTDVMGIAQQFRLLIAGEVLLAVAYSWSLATDLRLDWIFSGMWHGIRPPLAKAFTRLEVPLGMSSLPTGSPGALDTARISDVAASVPGVCSPPH